MRTALDPGDQEFLERLNRLGSGTVQEICAEMGVTATAVRQRLARLQGLGLVSREAVRTGRGRPYHSYEVTAEGQRYLGENYGDLALILWREITNIEQVEVRREVFHRVRDALVERYGSPSRTEPLQQRVGDLCETLAEHGYDVEVDNSGELPILRENNCPYPELASSDSGICQLEHEVFEQVLGADLELTHCCLNGHHCCEFQAREASRDVEEQESATEGDETRP